MADVNPILQPYGNILANIPQNTANVQNTSANTALQQQQGAQVGLQNQRLAQQLKFYDALGQLIRGGAGTGPAADQSQDQSGEDQSGGANTASSGPASAPAVADQSGVAGASAPKGTARAAVAARPTSAGANVATQPAGASSTSASTSQQGEDDPEAEVASLMDEAHVLQAMRGAYYVSPVGDARDAQMLMAAVGTGDPAAVAGAQAAIARGVALRRSQSQLAASEKYDELSTVVAASHPFTMLDRMTDPYLRNAAEQIAKQYPNDPSKQDEIAGEFASQLGSQLHAFTGRDVKQSSDGSYRDAVTGLPISGVPVPGLTAYQYGKLLTQANKPVTVPQSDGSTKTMKTWEYAGAASANAYVSEVADRQAAAAGLNSHVAQTLGPQIQAAQQAAQAQRTQAAAAQAAPAQSAAVTDPTLRTALADESFKIPNTPVRVGVGATPGAIEQQKEMVKARMDLLQNGSEATTAAANSLTYLTAAQQILNNPNVNISKYTGLLGSSYATVSRLWNSDNATAKQEAVKYLSNAAVMGIKQTFASSRVAAQEVNLALQEMNPNVKQTPAAMRDLVNTNIRRALYAIQSARRIRPYLGSRGDPTSFQQWNQQYWPQEKVVNPTPNASGSTATGAARISSVSQYNALPRGARYVDPNGVPRVKQ